MFLIQVLFCNFSIELINHQKFRNNPEARNTLEPTNIKAASPKKYEDVVKAPIAKTQDWLQKKREQVLDAPLPNVGPIPLGPTPNMTVRDGIDAAKDSFDKIVGDKDGGKGTEGLNNLVDGLEDKFASEKRAKWSMPK